MHPIKLVVLDMAGTTIQDLHEVEYCFKEAAKLNQLIASDERILALQGYAKLEVFRLLWTEQLGENHPDIEPNAQQSYTDFKNILVDGRQPNFAIEGQAVGLIRAEGL